MAYSNDRFGSDPGRRGSSGHYPPHQQYPPRSYRDGEPPGHGPREHGGYGRHPAAQPYPPSYSSGYPSHYSSYAPTPRGHQQLYSSHPPPAQHRQNDHHSSRGGERAVSASSYGEQDRSRHPAEQGEVDRRSLATGRPADRGHCPPTSYGAGRLEEQGLSNDGSSSSRYYHQQSDSRGDSRGRAGHEAYAGGYPRPAWDSSGTQRDHRSTGLDGTSSPTGRDRPRRQEPTSQPSAGGSRGYGPPSRGEGSATTTTTTTTTSAPAVVEAESLCRFLDNPAVIRANESLAMLRAAAKKQREQAFQAQLDAFKSDRELRAIQQELETTWKAIQLISESAAKLTAE